MKMYSKSVIDQGVRLHSLNLMKSSSALESLKVTHQHFNPSIVVLVTLPPFDITNKLIEEIVQRYPQFVTNLTLYQSCMFKILIL